jgi:GNAT superfamily N-acetyltransferase
MKEVDLFLLSGRRSQWLFYPFMKIYVRRGIRIHGETFDVASINVDEDEQGKGIFTAWLTELERHLEGKLPIYIENIQNARLVRFFKRRPGYRKVFIPGSDFDICFIKENGCAVGNERNTGTEKRLETI